jgi:DNA-binding NarL/FixJ family response regulator
LDPLANALCQAETTDDIGGAVADAVQRRIGMSAFSMLSCFGPVIAPTDLFALNSRVAPSRVQATIPDVLPLIERELEPFASALQPQKSYDIADRFPQDVVRRSEVFNTVWRPFAVERQLVGYLATPQDLLGFICVARSSREPAFTPSDLRAFENVRSTVEQALTAARRIGTNDLEDALAVLSKATLEPWFLFDASGHLHWVTDEGRLRLSLDAVRIGSSIALRHSAVLERLRAWVRRQARARDGSSVRAPPQPPAARSGEQFVAREFEVSRGRRFFLVGFSGATQRARPDSGEADPAEAELRAGRLARRYSLTPRQARVLAQLAWGKSNKTIAATLGCAEVTVEVHVTAILSKLGCANRAEAVARFWTS